MDPSQPVYARCECSHCSGHLEFERGYAGMTVPCPHCGQDTVLSSPATPTPVISITAVPTATPAAPPVAASSPTVPPQVEEPDSGLPHYPGGGGEIRLGDRVRYQEISAKVVFLAHGEHGAYAPGFSEFAGSDFDVVVCDDEGWTYTFKGGAGGLTLVHH